MLKRSFWPLIWGGLDLIYMLGFMLLEAISGKIPFVSDLMASYHTSILYGSIFPELLVALSSLLYISLIVSGIYLLRRKRIGVYVAWIQVIPRLVFFVPSLFVIILPLMMLLKSMWLVLPVFIVTEVLKIYSLHNSKFSTEQFEEPVLKLPGAA